MLGGTFQRIQFTPDLVPADLVGTRIYRPNTGTFDTELGPVFTNFLLADEINRAPAKVQSALLEVMQELTVTIGGTTHVVERPFLVMATQNPIESEGTYPLPEAQVDRFMLKVLVDYPAIEDEHTVAQRALQPPVDVQRVIELPQLLALQAAVQSVYVDPAVTRYAVRLASVTRDLAGHGLESLAPFVSFGVSPRGPISMLHAARALAVLRGRRYVLPSDVHELAPDAMRHRLVMSYRALAEGVSAEAVIGPVLETVPMPRVELVSEVA